LLQISWGEPSKKGINAHQDKIPPAARISPVLKHIMAPAPTTAGESSRDKTFPKTLEKYEDAKIPKT